MAPYTWIHTPRQRCVEELIVFLKFDRPTASALVDLGYVLRPGRFQTSAAGVAVTHPAKDGHDSAIPRGAAPASAALTHGGSR